MPKVLSRISKLVEEHATHAAIAGSVAVAIHVPEQMRQAFDYRIALVFVGVGLIVGDVIYRQHRDDAP